MRILFMGTPDFAVSSLKSIVSAGHTVCGVITQPDKPKGRGHKMAHPPVYEYAEAEGLKIYQPETLRDGAIKDILDELSPELIIVVAYGKILPEYILNYPKYGCVNVHASLLPKYRGAAPIQRSIIDGEKVTGVTTMYMAKGLDTGDMIEKAEVEITDTDNFETLHDKLAIAGSELILTTIKLISTGNVKREKQDDSLSTYAEMITKDTARIDWSNSAKDINNQIRGLCPAPKAFSNLEETQVKITLGRVINNEYSAECGEIVEVGKDFVRVKCSDLALDILEIQPAGKRVMAVADFLKGNEVRVGQKFN